MNRLFITFGARHGKPWLRHGFVGFYDTVADKWDIIRIPKRGFQGACFDGNKVWLAGYKKVYLYGNLRKKPIKTINSRKFSGLLSLSRRNGDLLIVSAGNNCVYKWEWDSQKVTPVMYCGDHPNTIWGNYVTCLNKHGTSRVYNLETGIAKQNPNWYMSQNYTKVNDTYAILNGDGRVTMGDKTIATYENRFLRGLLVKNQYAYIGLNWFFKQNRDDYKPPQIAVLDLETGLKGRTIEIPQMKKPWVIYDILEMPT